MRDPRFSAVRLLVPVIGIGFAWPTPAGGCTIDNTHGARRAGVSYLVVVPGARTLSAAQGLSDEFARVRPIPEYDEQVRRPREWWWWKARLTRLINRLRDRPPYGQVARLEEVGGADSARVRDAIDEVRGEVVLVRWGLTSDCRTALRTDRQPAFRAGERVFITGRLRNEAGWVGGRPTFDVTPDDYFYPERQYWTSQPSDDERRLRLTEFLSLYRALPDYELLQQDTASALAPLRAWVGTHASLAGKVPATRMIDRAQFYAREASLRRERQREATR